MPQAQNVRWQVSWVAATFAFGIATLFVKHRWAVAAFDLSLFTLSAAVLLFRRLDVRPPLLLLVPAWAIVQIAAGWTVDAWRTGESALEWMSFVCAFWLGRDVLADERTRERFLRAAALGGALIATIAIFQQAIGGQAAGGQAANPADAAYFGPFVYRNQFAAFIEALLPIAIVAAIEDRRRRIAWILAAATMFAGVIASGSRAGAVISFALLFLVPASACLRGWIGKAALFKFAAAVLASATILTFVAGWETIWARFQEQHPYSLRADLVGSTLEMIGARPVTGFGLGTWSTAYPAFARFDDGSFVNQAHNDWLQWTAEGGTPLLLLMLWIALRAIPAAGRTVWGFGMLAVFIHAMLDYPFKQRPALAAFFFLLLGALAAANTQRRHSDAGAGHAQPEA